MKKYILEYFDTYGRKVVFEINTEEENEAIAKSLAEMDKHQSVSKQEWSLREFKGEVILSNKDFK